jgi:hypothetical protein
MNSNLLIGFGFGWMVVSALIGLYLGAKHEGHLGQLQAAAASGNLPEYHRLFEAYKGFSSVHGHGMLFSLSSVAVGLVLSRNDARVALLGDATLVGLLISATVVWTLAAMRRVRPLMGLADLVFIGAIAITAASVAGSTDIASSLSSAQPDTRTQAAGNYLAAIPSGLRGDQERSVEK